MNAVKATTGRIVTVFEITEPLYKSMQNAVGGYIEIVRPKGLPHPYCMIVDEEGRLKNKLINEIGSVLYQTHMHSEPIVGDVAIVKEVDTEDGPDLCGLSESEVNYVLQIIERLCTERSLNAND